MDIGPGNSTTTDTENSRAARMPRQIIHLTTDELDAYFEGRAVTLDLAALTALRAADFQHFTSHHRT